MDSNPQASSWFFCREPEDNASMRLFCFPYSGAGASVFHSWPTAMGKTVEVRTLQLPGRETRYNEARETDIRAVVEKISNAIALYQDKPFAFFGYSLGSLLAFEVCRSLRRQNRPLPLHLFVAAMRAPQTPRVHPPLSPLPDAAFVQKIEQYYQPQGEVWQNRELRDFFLPVLRDDLALSDGYQYHDEPALNCPIDVFAGEQDVGAPLELTRQWAQQTSSHMHFHCYPGGHFFIDNALQEVQSTVLKALKKTGCA